MLLIQELKGQEENFPYDAMREVGYDAFVKGQKAYNGVATLIKSELKEQATLIRDILPGDESDEQARFLDIEIDGVHIINIYLPNGNPVNTPKFEYKLNWMNRLHDYLEAYIQARTPFIIGGDYNVIPRDIDTHSPERWAGDALFHDRTHHAYRALLNLGLSEAFRMLHPEEQSFTFWDYQAGAWPQNHGIRIDHFLLCPITADHIKNCTIDSAPRALEKASDHTPIIMDVALNNILPSWHKKSA
jgi:exodeoxyribonuclease-3